MKDKPIETILAECLDIIAHGELTLEQSLERYPEYREELAPLLQTALRLGSSPLIEPRPSFQNSARARILGHIASSKPVTLMDRIRQVSLSLTHLSERRSVMVWVLILTVITSLLSGGIAYASDGAVPGDAFYAVDRSVETARLSLMNDPITKTEYEFDLAAERLQEAEILSQRGDFNHVNTAIADYGRVISQISHTISSAKLADQVSLNQALDRSLDHHEAQLKTVFTNMAAAEYESYELSSPNQEMTPSLSFDPGEIELAGCTDAFQFQGNLSNTGDTSPDDDAANVVLGYQVIEGGEFVDLVEMNPFYWESIPAGEQVGFQVNVALNDDLTSFTNGEDVKINVFIASENSQVEHDSRLTLTIVSTCEETPEPSPSVSPTETITPTVTLTPSPTITPTVTLTPTITVTPTATITTTLTPTTTLETDCVGADPQPKGQTLANQFQVPYEEIMDWFCSGFGFGEIEHAYQASLDYGIPVEEIFGMRDAGIGWGEIWQYLESQSEELLNNSKNNKKNKDKNNGPPNGNGNPGGGPPEGAGPPNGNGNPGGGPPEGNGPPEDKGPGEGNGNGKGKGNGNP